MEKKPYDHGDESLNKLVQLSNNYYQESDQARKDRIDLNRQNWDAYHLRQDFSDKRPGQSREFLSKQPMAVEQITQFFHQGLVDLQDWFSVEYAPGVDASRVKISKETIRKLADRQLMKADFFTIVGDMVKMGLLSSLMICRVGGKRIKKPFYEAESKVNFLFKRSTKLKRGFKSVWQLDLRVVPPENFHQDPSGKKLFEMEEVYLDYNEVKALSEGDDAIYDSSVVSLLQKDMAEDYMQRMDFSRRTAQNQISFDYRHKVKVQEFWGKVIDQSTGEILQDNVVWTIANDRYVIQKPTPNPFWHGESPFEIIPIIRVPTSVWHRALMDSPTKNNVALNELYNLMVDGAMMSAYGIKQYRPDWIENESAYSEGFPPGVSIPINSNCPPGAKAIETVATGQLSQDIFAMFNIMSQEFNQSALTNDLRMGVLPGRQVKATEVVEASNTITSVFTGIAKNIEIGLEKIVDKSWKVSLQHIDDMNDPEVRALLGDQVAMDLMALTPEERYAESVMDAKFSVYGISRTLNKAKDFRKVTSLLQTISASPLLVQEFMQKFSMTKLLEVIMRALDINTDQLTMPPEEAAAAQQRMMMAMMMANNSKQAGSPDGMSVDQSQISQADGARAGSLNDTVEGRIGQSGFLPQSPGA